MGYNLVISNPPYGKIGAQITHNIIDTINFDEFVNLLPANDYHRGKDDLYQYVNLYSMMAVNNAFADAAVTTHVAKINKNKSLITESEFEVNTYIDKDLTKYFTETAKRSHYATDTKLAGASNAAVLSWDISKTVLFGYRDINHGHIPYTKDCTTFKYNVEESISNQYLIDNFEAKRKNKTTGIYEADGWITFAGVVFNEASEKDNFVEFMYSNDGFRFISKLFTAMNVDSTVSLGKVLPKVDWTREWTVEELLADYGYTEAEIKNVMMDLCNYKYMED